MNLLTNHLLEGLLSEEDKNTVALYGGGFKPPIGGHFEVVDEALKQYPEIDELIILVGSGERNGISQTEAILIWDIYLNYLPIKIKIQPSKSPIGDIYRFAKDNPQDIIYWIIGRREGAEDDDQDISARAKGLEKDSKKYDNLNLKIITTQDESMRGRNARAAIKKGKPYFTPFLPDILSKEDKSSVFDIVSPVLNENASYSKDIDYKQMIADLTNYMVKKGRNIEPLPKVEFIDGDSENAKDFFGKTAYYNPDTQTIILYTEGRHPKDIVRSFSHEIVHHTQWLEDRLGDIQTTNTMEDDKLDKIEQEANLVGTMTFRNWTDTINEKGGDTAWEDDEGNKVTLQDILDMTKNIPQKDYPTEKLAKIVLNWNDNPAEVDRISQVEISKQYPILIMVDEGGKIKWILDGNHRAQKALRAKSETIPAKLIKPSNLDAKAKKVLLGLPIKLNEEERYEKKKVKDPFGINAYALELSKGLEEEINEKEYTIYSDMDGVLVDFNNRFKRFSDGISPEDYEQKYGIEKFWEVIDNAGVRFWVGMDWMSDGKQLWDYIKKYNPSLLSSPSRADHSRMGKRIWRKRNLPSTKLVLAYAANKQNYANPNSILIDDRKSNVDQWVKAGGIGILHTDTASTIKKLKELGL